MSDFDPKLVKDLAAIRESAAAPRENHWSRFARLLLKCMFFGWLIASIVCFSIAMYNIWAEPGTMELSTTQGQVLASLFALLVSTCYGGIGVLVGAFLTPFIAGVKNTFRG